MGTGVQFAAIGYCAYRAAKEKGLDHEVPTVEIQDQDDLPILSAAISAGADVFVTGDKEILDLGRIEKLAILFPPTVLGETEGPTTA